MDDVWKNRARPKIVAPWRFLRCSTTTAVKVEGARFLFATSAFEIHRIQKQPSQRRELDHRGKCVCSGSTLDRWWACNGYWKSENLDDELIKLEKQTNVKLFKACRKNRLLQRPHWPPRQHQFSSEAAEVQTQESHANCLQRTDTQTAPARWRSKIISTSKVNNHSSPLVIVLLQVRGLRDKFLRESPCVNVCQICMKIFKNSTHPTRDTPVCFPPNYRMTKGSCSMKLRLMSLAG